ncbi:MAG: response regulator [Planctomycetes bacterium]|nr:response regulator [Planctomycetota bacterium]
MNKVLIVDDSATMRKIITRVLRQAEIPCASVVEAGNGVEGMARLQSDPDIDLILSDINMPEMNGVDFVKAVRATRAKEALPMIMVTTEGGEAMMNNALALGANGYVTKPFTPESIRAALEAYLG